MLNVLHDAVIKEIFLFREVLFVMVEVFLQCFLVILIPHFGLLPL